MYLWNNQIFSSILLKIKVGFFLFVYFWFFTIKVFKAPLSQRWRDICLQSEPTPQRPRRLPALPWAICEPGRGSHPAASDRNVRESRAFRIFLFLAHPQTDAAVWNLQQSPDGGLISPVLSDEATARLLSPHLRTDLCPNCETNVLFKWNPIQVH